MTTSIGLIDADPNPNYRPEGPTLTHFRDSNLTKVELTAKDAWQYILKHKTTLTTSSIKLFDDNGNYEETRNFTRTDEQQMDITSPTHNPTATFQELTEQELETLQHPTVESTTPSSTSLSTNMSTPHQPTHNMQPISLLRVTHNQALWFLPTSFQHSHHES